MRTCVDSTHMTRRQLLERTATLAALGVAGWVFPHRLRAVLASAGPTINVRNIGARGDGSTDDTVAIQAAIRQIRALGGGTVHFPPGTYLITSVVIYPGITYLGDRAVIKRPDDPAGRFSRALRTFNTHTDRYAGAEDSRPLVLRGLTFDGNVEHQAEKRRSDQAHLVFLSADKRYPGQLKVRIENCRFINSPADGITIYTNVDATITDTLIHNCRRGAVVCNGGYSRVRMSNVRATKGTHNPRLDMEIAASGYGDTEAVDLTMDQVSCEGNVELEIAGGTVTATNLTLTGPMFNIYGRGVGRATFRDCLISVGPLQFNRLQAPGTVSFERCTFRAWKDPAGTKDQSVLRALNILYESTKGRRDQLVRLLDCRFTVDTATVRPTEAAAVFTHADDAGANNRLVIEGGSISADYGVGLHMERGGNWTVREMSVGAAKALRLSATAQFPFNVLLDRVLVQGVPLSRRLVGEGRFEYP